MNLKGTEMKINTCEQKLRLEPGRCLLLLLVRLGTFVAFSTLLAAFATARVRKIRVAALSVLVILIAGCHRDDDLVGKWKMVEIVNRPTPESINVWMDIRPDGDFKLLGQMVKVPLTDGGMWTRKDKDITFTFAPGTRDLWIRISAVDSSVPQTTALSEDGKSFMLGNARFEKEN